MTLSTIKMTSRQYLQMGEDPPGVRFEVVNGELVASPSPKADHARIIRNLFRILDPHIRQNNLGEILGDLDTVFTEHTTRRPDLIFVAQSRKDIIGDVVNGPPDLCIEVISPSSATTDRVDKFQLYREHGVLNYWLIDPHASMAEAFVLQDGRYVLVAAGRDDAVVQFPPFPELRVPLADIWPA